MDDVDGGSLGNHPLYMLNEPSIPQWRPCTKETIKAPSIFFSFILPGDITSLTPTGIELPLERRDARTPPKADYNFPEHEAGLLSRRPSAV